MNIPIASLMVLLSVRAFAGSSASANYATTTEVLDSGGSVVSSANYAGDGSLGTVGRIVTLGPYQERGGFAGQLYELGNSLQITAPFTFLNEESGMALSPYAICTDTTLFALDPTAVTWGSTGPLSVTAAGAAKADPVFQDTAASVTATRGTATGNLALTVKDVLPDNFGTYAGDSLPDFWQVTYFGVGNPLAGPSADADNDGENNRLEYLATTVPTDPKSLFTLQIERMPGKEQQWRLLFSPYDSKRTYTLFSTVDPTDSKSWDFATPLDQGPRPGGYFFIHEAADDARFYRIEIAE